MDPALARMLARKKKQQEEAEEEDWKPSPVQTPAKPSIPPESSTFVMDENDPIAAVIGDALGLQEDDNLNRQAAAPTADTGPALAERASAAVANFSVPDAPPSAHAAAGDPFVDFFGASSTGAQYEAGATRAPSGDVAAAPEASASCALPAAVSSAGAADTSLASAPMAHDRGELQRAEVPGLVAGPRDGEASVKRAASGRKKKGEETFTKISSSAGSVPVLVIPTSGAGGDWRQGAQDVSSAYNG
jgi:hypothetical protein